MPLRRAARSAINLWTLWAHFAGILLLSTGIGFAVVHVISGEDAVATISDQRVMRDGVRVSVEGLKPPVVTLRPGEPLLYFFDMVRHEACRGEVIRSWSSADPKKLDQLLTSEPAVVTSKRPVTDYAVRTYDDVRAVVDQPGTISPGFWIFESGIQSVCPTRTRYDRIVRFTVEIKS